MPATIGTSSYETILTVRNELQQVGHVSIEPQPFDFSLQTGRSVEIIERHDEPKRKFDITLYADGIQIYGRDVNTIWMFDNSQSQEDAPLLWSEIDLERSALGRQGVWLQVNNQYVEYLGIHGPGVHSGPSVTFKIPAINRTLELNPRETYLIQITSNEPLAYDFVITPDGIELRGLEAAIVDLSKG